MKIDRVTFSGIDESINAEQILRVAEEYPSILTEWALLLSKSNEGSRPRYPDRQWMEQFIRETITHMQRGAISVAGHLQGRWLRSLAQGNNEVAKDRPTLWPYLQRVQLNFHGEKAPIKDGFFTQLMDQRKQFIFQMDGVNEDVYHSAQNYVGVNLVPLFDMSAGSGTVPDTWREPVHPVFNGYAGGFGPRTIDEQLKRQEQVVGDGVIWIDMETKIRSDDDLKFELDKCRQVLDIIAERSIEP